MATNLVILDRDGVINEDSDAYIKSPAEWHPIPGSLHAIARLRHAGYRVAVATNQSGIRRGLFDPEVLNQIHDRMHRMLAEVGGQIEAVVYCPCLPRDRCECRKPKPGMLLPESLIPASRLNRLATRSPNCPIRPNSRPAQAAYHRG